MKHLFQKGTLSRRVRRKTLLSDIIRLASADIDGEHIDINIITLRQWLREDALHEVLQKEHYVDMSVDDIDVLVDNLVIARLPTSLESVEIEHGDINIVVNFDAITDDAIDFAIGLLMQVHDFSTGQQYTFNHQGELI